MTDLFLPLPKLWLLKCLFSHWVETNVNRNQTYFNHYKSRIWESLWSAAWLWYCANITIRGILKKNKKKTTVKQRGPESVNRWDNAWWQSSYRLDTGTMEPAWFLCHFCRQRPPSDTGSGRAAHLTHKQDPHRNRNPCSTCSAQTAPPPDSQTHCCTGSPAQNLQKQNFSLDSWKWGLSTLLGALHMFLTYPLIGWTFHLIARRSITQLPCKWTALTNIVEPGSLESCTTSTDPHEHVHTSTHMKQWSSPLVGHKKIV